MLKKRLIGVVTVKNGWAVQSFGYKRYLPLGKPECLVENLDRWGVDEILIQVIDRSTLASGPDLKLLERVAALGIETPIIYAGGIRAVLDGINVIQSGADRIAVDSLLHQNLTIIKELSKQLGAQALIASLPLSNDGVSQKWFNYRTRISSELTDDVIAMFRLGYISEVLISDWQNEGMQNGFDQSLIENFPLKDVPVIAFGGLSEPEQMRKAMQIPSVTACAIGNFLSYREHAIQKYKETLEGIPIRLASYESNFSQITDE